MPTSLQREETCLTRAPNSVPLCTLSIQRSPLAGTRSMAVRSRRGSLVAKPNPKAKLGQGGRFAAVAAAAKKGGARNPEAVAAAVGRKKYGEKKMAKMAAEGRKRGGT